MFLMGRNPDAAEALAAFRWSALHLFAGSAFIAIGLLAGAFAFIRRKYEPLIVYFALFASLYGLRLWIQSDILRMAVHDSTFFLRFSAALDYVMPLPAFLFLSSAGLLRRFARAVLYGYVAVGIALALAACFSGPLPQFDLVNRAASVVALLVLVGDFVLKNDGGSSDLVIARRGLLTFVAFALFNNLRATFSLDWPNLEPIGFAIFLGTLGYVAARRILLRDHQLSEIQKELEVAKRIQLSILPSSFPPSNHFRVAARYVPMTSVAGDFYDYVLTGATQAGILIADVSGHGVPAALIASMVKLAAGSQRENAEDPGKFLYGMNTALFGNTQGQFVTAAYVLLDCELKRISYSAAGHPPMLLLRGHDVEKVEENGLIMAAFDFATYSQVRRSLHDGDRILLYTDGMMEAADQDGDFFGLERLAALLIDTAGLSVAEAADRIMSSVRTWSVAQEDDLTVIVCDFLQ